jgi:hypothetical protein
MRPLAALALGLFILTTAPADAKHLHLRKSHHTLQMRMTPFVINAGADREGCEYAVTPNKKAMDVQAFELHATAGTHHFVVWEYLGKDQNPSDFWDGIAYSAGCVGLGPQDGFSTTANLFGMQAATARVEFPPGVAVRLEPHAIIYPNLHLHNYLDTAVTAQAVFNFVPAKKGSVKHHAQNLTVGSFNIDVPANGSGTLTGEWHTPGDLNIVQLSTHQHRRGTGVSVHHIDAAGNDLGELVTTTDWDHPKVNWFRVPKRMHAGEGFRFTCNWQNPDDHAVRFGVTSEDEMCFVTGYFYLDDDVAKATGPGCVPQGAGLQCFVPRIDTAAR